MPKIEGYGGRSGGPLTGSPVPVPTKPVVHRGRPALAPSGFKMLNVEEFTPEQIEAKAPKPRRGRARVRRDAFSRGEVRIDVDLIVRLYVEEELTLREVVAKTGHSQTTLIKYLRAAGVQMRPAHYSRRQTDEQAAPKICASPACGKSFTRREGERTDAWNKRRCCDRLCAARLRVTNRAAA